MTARLPDQADREAAARDFSANQVVIAGAGTGKTSLLVERALVGLALRDIPIAGFAAITFTEKAAAELRERLADALEDLLDIASGRDPAGGARLEAKRVFETVDPDRRDRVAARARGALVDLDEASIGTIHAFCADLLRRHPFEAGVDPRFVVDEGPGMEALHRERWPLFLAEELGPSGARRELWRRALRTIDLAGIESVGREVIGFHAPLDAIEEKVRTGAKARDLLAPAVRWARGLIEPLASASLNDAPRQWVAAANDLLDRLERYGPDAIARYDPVDRPNFWESGRVKVGKRYEGSLPADEADAAILRVTRFLKSVRRVDELAVNLVFEVLLPYARATRRLAIDRGVMPFDGLLQLARDLLKRDRGVREEEKQRVRMLLVDEFQDTDPLQYEIVLSVAERNGTFSADPYAARLEAGKLFVVGDPKQSIYRFRGADIAAARRAVEAIVRDGGARRVLSTNFRSPPALLEPLNRLFEANFSRHGRDVQPAYEPILSPQPRSPEGAGIEVVSILPGDELRPSAHSQREREGRAIAAEIEALNAKGRGLSDMALLLSSMTNVPLYTRALRDRGIRFVVEGGKVFGAKPEVRLLLSLLSAIANRNDAVAFLAVARSPLGAATDAELSLFAAEGGRLPPYDEPDEDRFPALARTFRLLAALRADARSRTVDEAVRMTLESTPLLTLAAVAFDGAQAVANLRALAARAAELSRGVGLSLEATVDALREEFDQIERGETPLADEQLDAVRVLTVHKAKGLEFPVVFVGDLRREKGRPRGPFETAAELRDRPGGTDGDRICLVFSSSGREILSAAEALRRMEERDHDDAEDLRCFYVATTRAKEQLRLIQSDPSGGGTWTRYLDTWGYVCRGRSYPDTDSLDDGSVAHRKARTEPGRRAAGEAEEQGLGEAVRRFDEAYRGVRDEDREWVTRPTALKAGARGVEEERIDGERETIDEEGDPFERRLEDLDEEDAGPGPAGRRRPALAVAAGTVFHALLERWDRADPDWLTRTAPLVARREAAALGLDEDALRAEIGSILSGFLASDLPARLAAADLVGRELPVFHPEQGRLVQGVADLVYRDGDTLVVADHKTDAVSRGEIAELVRRYRPQLSAYARAARAACPAAAVRAELWLARLGTIVPVDLD